MHFTIGAGSGIDQLAARRALAAGHKVAAVDINEKGLAQLGASEQLLSLRTDITNPAVVHEAVERTQSEFGPIKRGCCVVSSKSSFSPT